VTQCDGGELDKLTVALGRGALLPPGQEEPASLHFTWRANSAFPWSIGVDSAPVLLPPMGGGGDGDAAAAWQREGGTEM
jgi:hypothetical protein